MSEAKVIKIVAAEGTGIPRTLKTYRSINVQSLPNGQGQGKVIRVALPQNIILGKSSSQPVVEQCSRSDDDGSEGAPLSKNAILARENRRKRKQYVTGLESSVTAARKENEVLKDELKQKDDKIVRLEREVAYLKNVLANVDEISGLIRTIKCSSSLPISSSFDPPVKKVKLDRLSESSGDCSSLLDTDYDLNDWLPSTPLQDSLWDTDSPTDLRIDDLPLVDPYLSPKSNRAGVCLHVLNKKISLEFCSECSSRALENWAKQV